MSVKMHEYTEMEQSLIRATELGELEKVKELIGQGGDINTVNKFYQNLLFLACLHGHVELALFLLDKGADATNKGIRPFHRLTKDRRFILLLKDAVLKEEYYLNEYIGLITAGDDIGLGEELLNTAKLRGYHDLKSYLKSPFNELYKFGYDELKATAFNAACANGNMILIKKLLAISTLPGNEPLLKSISPSALFFPTHIPILTFLAEQQLFTLNDFKDLPLIRFSEKQAALKLLETVSIHNNLSKEKALDLFLWNHSLRWGSSDYFATVYEEVDLSKLSSYVLNNLFSYFEDKSREISEKIAAYDPQLQKKYKNKYAKRPKKPHEMIKWESLEKKMYKLAHHDILHYAKKHPDVVCCNFIMEVSADNGIKEMKMITFEDIYEAVGKGGRSELKEILKKYHSIGEFKKNAGEQVPNTIILNRIEDIRTDSPNFEPIDSEKSIDAWEKYSDKLIEASLSDEEESVQKYFLDLCCRVALNLWKNNAFEGLKLDPDFKIIVRGDDEEDIYI